jgi:hypothetical protein
VPELDLQNSNLERGGAFESKSPEFEKKLRDVSLIMGEVLKDKQALNELFSFAKLEGNDNDVEYSLKRLFEENSDPLSRKRSAIESAFQKTASNYRTAEGEDLSIDLIEFITQQNIGVLAPYLANNFDPEQIKNLTVSWWTQEFEDWNVEMDSTWEGKTKAIELEDKLEYGLSNFRTNNASVATDPEVILVGDEYAKENPTIVFGAYQLQLPPDDGGIGGGSPPPDYIIKYPHEIGVNCTNVLPTDIVRFQMENFKLTGNTRAWPHPNRITIWVNSSTNLSTVPLVNEKKIERGSVGDWLTDFIPNSGILATSWEQVNYNQNIVMAYYKPTVDVTQTVITYKANAQGQIEPTSSFTVTKSDNRAFMNMSWLRCGELNGNYSVDVGNGMLGLLSIWSQDLQRKGYMAQFTIAPKIVRFQ